MNTEPKVAVIICNWNKKDYVLNCIQSVKASSYTNYDLIVVDNASTDGSAEAIRTAYPNDVLLVNRENLGGTGGFNTGMKYAMNRGGYDYLHLLDNDVVVAPDAIAQLVNALENAPEAGVAGSKICFMDRPDKIHEIGAFVNFKAGINIKPNSYGRKDNKTSTKTCLVDYAAACSLMVRTSVVKEVGIMDEGFFLYWDDIDWCARIRRQGYKILGVGSSKIWHKMGGTVKTSTLPNYYWTRNSIYYFNKYVADDIRKKSLRKILEYYYEAIYTCRFYGKRKTAITFCEAIKDALKGRRGKIGAGQFSEVEKNQRFSIDDLMKDGNRLFMLNNRYYKGVFFTLQKKYPHVKITVLNTIPEDFDKRVFIPCVHVFNQRWKGTAPMDRGHYWMDMFTNILPVTTESEKAVHIYQKRKDAFLSTKLNDNSIRSGNTQSKFNSSDSEFSSEYAIPVSGIDNIVTQSMSMPKLIVSNI
jgi:GT2 family glycosyltransferase